MKSSNDFSEIVFIVFIWIEELTFDEGTDQIYCFVKRFSIKECHRLERIGNFVLTEIEFKIGNCIDSNFFTEFRLGALFYDGTAQGSLIQFDSSPYLLTEDQIDPLIVNFYYGFSFAIRKLKVSYCRVITNNSFRRNTLFGRGEITIFVGL